jgi:hypothetical protein
MKKYIFAIILALPFLSFAETTNLNLKSVVLQQAISLDWFYYGQHEEDRYLSNLLRFVNKKQKGQLSNQRQGKVFCDITINKDLNENDSADPIYLQSGKTFEVKSSYVGETWDWGHRAYALIQIQDPSDRNLTGTIQCRSEGLFASVWDFSKLSEFLAGVAELQR